MANNDVFNAAQTEWGGAFSADSVVMTFAGAGPDPLGVGLITQQMQYQYQQSMNLFYELGSNKGYLLRGRPEGSLGGSRIIGPSGVVAGFYTRYGDICQSKTNNLIMNLAQNDACTGAAGVNSKYSFNNIVLNSIGGSVSAQEVVITENFQMRFLSMNVA
jgi:hypothetical protein